jgi:hypothetical protein
MKLPLEFSIKLVFRLVFAGIILAAALVPAVHGLVHAIGTKIKAEYLFPVEVIVWGWAVLICDMRIYMLFEGRRYWPAWLKELFIRSEQRRLKKLADLLVTPNVDRRRYLEAGVEYGLFPVDEGGDAYVAHPTRLGNIIESFETYPKVKYGLDAVFYWYRLWVVLDKDVREEIDSAQSVVDSTIYVAFAFFISGLVMFAYAALAITHTGWAFLSWLPAIELPYVPRPAMLCGLGGACLVVGYLVYRLCLPAHAQFGELFKSIFDQFRSKLVFDDVLQEVGRTINSPYLGLRSQRDKNQIVWRYLRWHMIRDEAAQVNLTVKKWRERQESAKKQDQDIA